jgi:GNAT superfamily N-acetyltransferase
MRFEVHRFTTERLAGFFAVHSTANEAGWCFCAAWWVPTWEGWGARSAEDNRSVRDRLCEAGQYDGYLIYVDGRPAGWCQTGPRDRLRKLCNQYNLEPSPETWAITCFLIPPEHRRSGLASRLLDGVLADLRSMAVRRVEAFPRRGDGLEAGDLWTGPEEIYRRAGFDVAREDSRRPILALDLEGPGKPTGGDR